MVTLYSLPSCYDVGFFFIIETLIVETPSEQKPKIPDPSSHLNTILQHHTDTIPNESNTHQLLIQRHSRDREREGM